MGIPEPRTPAGRAGLAALLAEPRSAVVALDFDGTLAPIVADPDQARAHPAAVAALEALEPLVGAVVVVTGRPAAAAVEYGGFAGLERFTVLGQYGAERWEAGVLTSPPPPPGVAAARERLPSVLAESGAPAGTWVEDKGRALAVHTRRTADPQGALEQLRAPLEQLAAAHGLMVEPGRYVLELRPPGVDKGGALTAFLAERPPGPVLYAGDDLGDIPAYAALEQRRADGNPALLVCSSATTGEAQVTELADRADLLVPGPAGVAELLAAVAARL
ncbi:MULTISPECIES: trehalose-phosphatase [unclassified Kitasatospora]|uniref:trehalose-phosphatase n=1 Tax=unclassified Kitasatospora TaxID=2633591 RepID=UPI00070EDE0E|nr:MULTISPECIES: trehalose-phosphatase [unclassified Kitasatospora]KQV24181.1 trehalose phosphatase [Kitasatospora sp. Root107]KRB67105.1 trehalose phosphatase [Kitasatospora sp. Root187]